MATNRKNSAKPARASKAAAPATPETASTKPKSNSGLLTPALVAAITALLVSLLWWAFIVRPQQSAQGDMNVQIQELRTELASVRVLAEAEPPAPPPQVDLAPVEQRLSALESIEAPAPVEPGMSPDAVQGVIGTAIAATVASTQSNRSKALADLSGDLTQQIETARADLTASFDTRFTEAAEMMSGLTQRLDGTEQSLAALDSSVTDATAAMDNGMSTLQAETSATLEAFKTEVDADIASQIETGSAAAVDASMTVAMPQMISAIRDQMAMELERRAAGEQLTQALDGTGNLQDAVTRFRNATGESLPSEISDLLGGRLADGEVKSPATILDGFDRIAQPLLQSRQQRVETSAGLGGIGARLSAALDVGTDTPAAGDPIGDGIMSLRQALEADDSTAALQAYQALPADLKSLFGPSVQDQLTRRDAAEAHDALTNWLNSAN